MKFAKRRYKVGSNQYQRKYKTAQRTVWKTVRGYIALFIFLGSLAYALTLPIYAAEKHEPSVRVNSEQVVAAGESAKIKALEDKVHKLEKAMQLQVQLNELNEKWMQAQEVINLGI